MSTTCQQYYFAVSGVFHVLSYSVIIIYSSTWTFS